MEMTSFVDGRCYERRRLPEVDGPLVLLVSLLVDRRLGHQGRLVDGPDGAHPTGLNHQRRLPRDPEATQVLLVIPGPDGWKRVCVQRPSGHRDPQIVRLRPTSHVNGALDVRFGTYQRRP